MSFLSFASILLFYLFVPISLFCFTSLSSSVASCHYLWFYSLLSSIVLSSSLLGWGKPIHVHIKFYNLLATFPFITHCSLHRESMNKMEHSTLCVVGFSLYNLFLILRLFWSSDQNHPMTAVVSVDLKFKSHHSYSLTGCVFPHV